MLVGVWFRNKIACVCCTSMLSNMCLLYLVLSTLCFCISEWHSCLNKSVSTCEGFLCSIVFEFTCI